MGVTVRGGRGGEDETLEAEGDEEEAMGREVGGGSSITSFLTTTGLGANSASCNTVPVCRGGGSLRLRSL